MVPGTTPSSTSAVPVQWPGPSDGFEICASVSGTTNIESMTRIAIGQKPGRRKVDNMEILVQMDRSALHLHPGVSSIQGREWTLLPCQPDIIRVPWRDCDAVVTIATMFTSQMNEI